jgi:hypothetical protein
MNDGAAAVVVVDLATAKRELRSAVLDMTERGLIHSAKWYVVAIASHRIAVCTASHTPRATLIELILIRAALLHFDSVGRFAGLWS